MSLLSVFSTHYGFTHSSLLTVEEAGKTKAGNPTSICDLAIKHNLKQVVIVDETVAGFLEAYKNLSKINVQLIFGLKLCVCADMSDKTDSSLPTQSNVIVFLRNTQGYHDLLRLYNRAFTDGYYGHKGRADWKLLKTYWTDNLALALPTYSSFIFKNLMTLSNIVPDFPVKPTLFREIDSGLPFAALIDNAITQFAAQNGLETQDVKSIYYEDGARDFDAYTVFRAMGNRAEFSRPEVPHMCSDRFSFSSYLSLSKTQPTRSL